MAYPKMRHSEEALIGIRALVLWLLVVTLILVATYSADYSLDKDVPVACIAALIISIPALATFIGYYLHTY